MVRILSLFIILIIMSTAVFADCIIPTDSLIISNDTTFCPGSFSLAEGMIVNNDNIIIECNNTMITGKDEGYGLLINKRKGNIIRKCIIQGFQMGIALQSSNQNQIVGNIILENEIGIFISASNGNKIFSNIILNNSKNGITLSDSKENTITGNAINLSEYGLYMISSFSNNISENHISSFSLGFYINQQNSDNYIYDNWIYNVGFAAHMMSDKENNYCLNDIGNIYLKGAIGPPCKAESIIENMTEIAGENVTINQTTAIIELINDSIVPKEKINESTIPKINQSTDKKEDVSRIKKQVIEEFELQQNPSLKETTKILKRALIKEGLDGNQLNTALKKKIDEYTRTRKHLTIEKELITNNILNITTIQILITPEDTIYDLYVYEFVPKCIADSIDNIRFLEHEPLKILEPDPLFVWYFPKVGAGQKINLSYEVNKPVDFSPTTIAIVNGTSFIKKGVGQCSEEPISIACGKRNWKLLIPLLLVPVIIFLYIFFYKFQIKT